MRIRLVSLGGLPIVPFLLALTISLLMMTGCGGSSGSGAGGCGTDTAPAGAAWTGPGDVSYPPFVTASGVVLSPGQCATNLVFTLKDSLGNPLNDLNLEIQTNGFIAKHQTGVTCVANLNANGVSATVGTTSAGGTIALDVGSFIFSKPTPTTASSSQDIQVQLSSCSAVVLQSNTFTVTWTP
jgi:hypothetical protein